jgi:hypothetical protein
MPTFQAFGLFGLAFDDALAAHKALVAWVAFGFTDDGCRAWLTAPKFMELSQGVTKEGN